ncbi:MAG: glycosyltransferase family 2 protein [Bacteroidota bacterium]
MMNNTPQVSLVTVVRNGAAHVEKCISSVLNQTYPDIEYIIIDGGSTDGTLSIINKYKTRIAVIVSEPDKGIADAFNKGLKLAQGEITGLLNADDWLEPDAVMNIVATIGSNDILYGNMRQWNPGGTKYILTGNHLRLPKGMSLNHPSVFIRKRVYQKVGYYNTNYKLAMDYEFLLRCFLAGATFKRIDKLLTNMKTAT